MRQYLVSIISAGILCTLVTTFFHKNTAIDRIISLLCGTFMTFTLIAPVKHINLSSVIDLPAADSEEVDAIIAKGEQYTDNSVRQVITEQCRTYIVEKASGMGVSVNAEVVLNQKDPPTPCAVTIIGSVSPYQKTRIEEMLTQDLGIPKEQQTWK